MTIIRVNKLIPGWEAIPNNFANDLRLSADAVAVGLWLATKPAGWQVRPVVIQDEFSRRPGKVRGRDWWARVSSELKSAGYMRLTRIKDAKGQFASRWDFCVFGLDAYDTNVGLADDGSAVSGLSDGGYASQSKHHPINTARNKNTTHSKGVGISERQGVCREIDAMLSSMSLSAGTRKLIENELSALTSELQKLVLNEFIAHRASIRHPVPWIRRVCSDTFNAGDFTPAEQVQSTHKISRLNPVKFTCEIDACKKYAATQTSRGWRCVDHISR